MSLHSGRHNVQCPRPIICRFNSIASIAALPPALPRALPGPRCMPRDDRSGLFNAKDLLLDGSRKKCSVRVATEGPLQRSGRRRETFGERRREALSVRRSWWLPVIRESFKGRRGVGGVRKDELKIKLKGERK